MLQRLPHARLRDLRVRDGRVFVLRGGNQRRLRLCGGERAVLVLRCAGDGALRRLTVSGRYRITPLETDAACREQSADTEAVRDDGAKDGAVRVDIGALRRLRADHNHVLMLRGDNR